jgi:hypothetical protein
MSTESKVTEMFWFAEDFCKCLDAMMIKKMIRFTGNNSRLK